eukprot:scaffold119470_cov87-Cyclotella_meneghiniana.AAC.5
MFSRSLYGTTGNGGTASFRYRQPSKCTVSVFALAQKVDEVEVGAEHDDLPINLTDFHEHEVHPIKPLKILDL